MSDYIKAVPDAAPEEQLTPLIVGVAIRDAEGHVWSMNKPAAHAALMKALAEIGAVGAVDGEKGFMTSSGDFVDRMTALWIAINNGQYDAANLPIGKKELFSYDLW